MSRFGDTDALDVFAICSLQLQFYCNKLCAFVTRDNLLKFAFVESV